MAQLKKGYATKSGAARLMRISRRTVQRYCAYELIYKLDPPLTDGRGNVCLSVLKGLIMHLKEKDGRGFPLGAKRYARQPTLLKPAKTFGRSYRQRLELIQKEIDAMSDGEQVSLLLRWSRQVFSKSFRPVAYERAKAMAPHYKAAAERSGREADYVSGWFWLD